MCSLAIELSSRLAGGRGSRRNQVFCRRNGNFPFACSHIYSDSCLLERAGLLHPCLMCALEMRGYLAELLVAVVQAVGALGLGYDSRLHRQCLLPAPAIPQGERSLQRVILAASEWFSAGRIIYFWCQGAPDGFSHWL